MPSFCRVSPNQFEGGSKDFEPLEPCDLKLLGKIIQRYMWSPGVFAKNERCNANFLYSDFIGFDVDNNDGEIYTLEEAINNWQDSECIIATTRHHMKEKVTDSKTYPPAPRFRIITRWESRITDPHVFRHTVQTFLRSNSHFDRICCDPARMFYPSTHIVFEQYEGYRQPVLPLPPILKDPRLEKFLNPKEGLPPHIEKFLKMGKVYSKGRNNCVYITTLTMMRAGYAAEKVLELIEKSPFSREHFSEFELLRAYNNGLQAFLNENKKIG